MKRLLILSFILLTALMLICSCGEDEPTESSTSAVASSEITTDSSKVTTDSSEVTTDSSESTTDSNEASVESSESTTVSSNVAASGKDDLWTGNKQ